MYIYIYIYIYIYCRVLLSSNPREMGSLRNAVARPPIPCSPVVSGTGGESRSPRVPRLSQALRAGSSPAALNRCIAIEPSVASRPACIDVLQQFHSFEQEVAGPVEARVIEPILFCQSETQPHLSDSMRCSSAPPRMSHAFRRELLSHGLGLLAGHTGEGSMVSIHNTISHWHRRDKAWKQASLAERDIERQEWRQPVDSGPTAASVSLSGTNQYSEFPTNIFETEPLELGGPSCTGDDKEIFEGRGFDSP